MKRTLKIGLLFFALLVAMMLVLSACTDDKDEESTTSPSQAVESQQPSKDGDTKDKIPDGAIIEDEVTFEVDEGKVGPENGFSQEVVID